MDAARRLLATRVPGSVPWSVWLFLTALAFNIFSGYSRNLGLPIGVDRVLFPAAIVLALLEPHRPRLQLRAAHYAMAAVSAIVLWSVFTLDLVSDTTAVFAVLDRILMPFALFTAAPLIFRTPRSRALLVGMLAIIGSYLTITILLETLRIQPLLFPPYIAGLQAEYLAAHANEVYRPSGPFGASEANGMALAMCGFGVLLLAEEVRRVRLLRFVIGPACVIASILSMTRSVWLAVAITAAVLLWQTNTWRRWLPKLLAAGVVAAVAAILLAPTLVDDLVNRGDDSQSLWDRQNTNAAAMRIMAEKPLNGVGWGQFVVEGWDWVRQADTYPMTNTTIEVHNVFLSRGAELGVPGGLAFIVCVVAGPGLAAWRRLQPAFEPWRWFALSTFLIWVTVSLTSPNPYPFPTFLTFIVAGLALCLPAANDPYHPPTREGFPDAQTQ